MYSRALVIIDMQKGIVDNNPYRYKDVLGNIKILLNYYRSKNYPIIHIQHSGTAGSTFEPGTHGWEIVDELKPEVNEPLYNKRYNSAFKETGLDEKLKELSIKELIIVGMQTEYCIDTSVRIAFEKGYKVFTPKLTNTTVKGKHLSSEAIYRHHNDIFQNRFSENIKIEELM